MKTYNPPLSKLENYDRQFIIRTIVGFCLALGSIVALHGIIYLLQLEVIKRESGTAALVSATGEQRMRSQRIPLLSLALLNVQSDAMRLKIQKSIESEVKAMEENQLDLIAGDPERGIRSEKSEAVRDIFFGSKNLDSKTREFMKVAKEISQSEALNLTLRNPKFFALTEQSSVLLDGFEELKQLYKLEGDRSTLFLIRIARSAFLVVLITAIGVGLFIFKPIIRRLKVEFQVRSQTQKELIDQNKELEHFSTIVAHDLKAPLTNIGGFSQFLKTKLVNQDDREALELMDYIEQGVNRMTQMITELLQYAKLSKKEIKFDKVYPGNILSRVIKDFESQISETGAKIIYGQLPIIRGDSLQFEHLFQNLLSNALKFRHPERTPRIEIFLMENGVDSDESVIIAFQDNGRGFPSGSEEKMFEPFRRLSSHKDTDGSGFGLALCKKIMNRHNGSISVENVASGGARFILTFRAN